MPDLPTITVTSTQAQILLSVFPGATTAEKTEAYREWLRRQLVAHVKDVRRAVIQAEDEARLRESEAKTDAEVGGI